MPLTPLTAEQMETLPQYAGLIYDPATEQAYNTDGTPTGWTFARAKWEGPFGIHLTWPWLNPIGFATHHTGERVLTWVKRILPKGLAANLDETQRAVGPFTRTIERQIVVTDGDHEESYSAGWLAHSLIKNGEDKAARYWLDELHMVPWKL